MRLTVRQVIVWTLALFSLTGAMWNVVARIRLQSAVARCHELRRTMESAESTRRQGSPVLDDVKRDLERAFQMQQHAFRRTRLPSFFEFLEGQRSFEQDGELATEILENYRSVVQTVRDARLPGAEGPRDIAGEGDIPSLGHTSDWSIPYWFLAELVRFAGTYDLELGQGDDAVSAMNDYFFVYDMMVLTRDQRGWFSVYAFYEPGFEWLQTYATSDYLRAHLAAPASRSEVLACIERLRDDEAVWDAFALAYIEQAIFSSKWDYSPGLPPLRSPPAIGRPVPNRKPSIILDFFLRPLWLDDRRREINTLFAAADAMSARNWPVVESRHKLGLRRLLPKCRFLRPYTYTTANSSMDFGGWDVEDRYVLFARRRLACIQLALRLYRAEHGDWPESLSALVPEYLREVPADPFSSVLDPMTYERLADGRVCIGTTTATSRSSSPVRIGARRVYLDD